MLLTVFKNLFSSIFSNKQPSLIQVTNDDEVSRFITSRKNFNTKGRIKYPAFMPYAPEKNLELSLYCTTGTSHEVIWGELSKKIQKTPYGRGIIKAIHFFKEDLELINTPDNHPLHLDAIKWPHDKGKQILIARKLADEAKFEKNLSTK